MTYSNGQKFLAEFIGPLALVFVGGGAVTLYGSAGIQTIVALALAQGLVIATMVSAVGHISGGHLNPAVTIGAWVAQKIDTAQMAMYLVAQLAGAAAGAGLLRLALPESLWKQGKLGATIVNTQAVSNGQAVLIEAMLTFFLVWVVFAVAVDPNGSFGKVAGLPIGFVVTMNIFFGGLLTGGSMNPARSFGPALVAGEWTGLWVYFVGPIAGGIVAAALYDTVYLRRRKTIEEELADAEAEVEVEIAAEEMSMEAEVTGDQGHEPRRFGTEGDQGYTPPRPEVPGI